MVKSHSESGKTNRSRPSFIGRFLRSERDVPVIAAVAAGLYPILFYFTNNYTLINTWAHLGYFVLFFLLVPIVIFLVANRVFKLPFLRKWHKYVIPFLNVFIFAFLLEICLYADIQKKLTALLLVVAALFAFFLYKHLKKVIVIQFVLAGIGIFTLIPTVISQLNYSKEWMTQPDEIEQVEFTKKPNIYFLQPDGYVNFSELRQNRYYQVEQPELEGFLESKGFKNYDNFRSNYASTLSSNSATFMMKHHHYNKGSSFTEAINARNVIISDNTVLRVLRANGYKTHFLAEKPYLLLNRPELGYDYSNFDYDDIAFIGTGLGEPQDIITPLKQSILIDPEKPKFFFVEVFNPGHIHGRKADSRGIQGEKELWLESVESANIMVKNLISTIQELDPNALIVIMADHGGFVGMEYTNQTYKKTEDRDLIYSIFSSQLSISWPNADAPDFDTKFSSAVNVFRILFSYLSDDTTYLNELQPDESYVLIKEDAPKGTYMYIDDEGKIVFKKH